MKKHKIPDYSEHESDWKQLALKAFGWLLLLVFLSFLAVPKITLLRWIYQETETQK